MNKKFLLKTWLLLALMVLGVSSAWADPVTVSMTTFSAISGNVDDDENISYAAAKGSAGTAPAVNSGQIRVYQNGGTFTVSANNGAKINSITLGSAMKTSVSYKVDNGTESENQSITANGTITVNNIDCTTVLFTCKGTDKNSRLYVNSLSVTYTPAATIVVTKPEFIFYESFDQNTGNGGNDGQWSGTVGTGTIITDNPGWSFTRGSSNSQCAKLGTSSVKGSATTPSLGQAGNLIVSFKAGAWKGDQTELVLSVNGGGTLSTETVTMANAAWTDYEVIIYGATAETSLTFAGTQDDKARFFLDEVKVKEAVEKVTVTEAGYATLCADKTLNFDGLEVKAYKAAMDVNDGNVVTFTPVTKVPAGAGVLLKAEPGEYEVPVTASADELKDNILMGVSKDGQTVDGSDSNFSYYVLRRNQNGSAGFYKIVADDYKLKKGTAYLKVAGSNAKNFIGFDGTETAVEAVAAQEQFAGELYNLQGQRVGNDYKGIVIVNGKKVIR